MRWLAYNTLMLNGDFVDESLVVVSTFRCSVRVALLSFITSSPQATERGEGQPPYLRFHPWDYESVWKPCHVNAIRALRDDLFYCAESYLDLVIAETPQLRGQLNAYVFLLIRQVSIDYVSI